MKEKLNISPMKTLDQYFYDQINDFKEGQTAQKLFEKYNILEESEQKQVNFVLMIISILIPLMVVFIFYSISSSKKEELLIKQNIIEKSSEMIAKKKQLHRYTRSVFGSQIDSIGDFKSKINRLLSMQGIDTSKIQITDFDSFDQSGITNSMAKLVFNGLSNDNLIKMMRSLFVIEKFKVEHFNISKNKSSNLLDGNFDIIYYGKQSEKL